MSHGENISFADEAIMKVKTFYIDNPICSLSYVAI